MQVIYSFKTAHIKKNTFITQINRVPKWNKNKTEKFQKGFAEFEAHEVF